ncbi:MAG: DUF2267 domain-containing protein [Armatimonadota bacterium]
MTKKELLMRVMMLPGVTSQESAEEVVSAVFRTLRDRLTPDEADDVWAQLPTAWKELWESGGWLRNVTARMRGMNKLDRDEFVEYVSTIIPETIPAEEAVQVVFHALKEQISAGEAEDVSSQLPKDLRTMWKAA